MLYKYNKNNLTFEKIKLGSYIKVALFVLFIGSSLGFTSAVKLNQTLEKVAIIIRPNSEELTEENLRKEIKKLNLPFEDIIVRQAYVESGMGKSLIYKENNNFLGMKLATIRPTIATGENRKHATFNSWKECLIDYSLWYAAYGRQAKTEDEYYQLLDAIYSESGNYYSEALKKVKV